jgi:GNAT superfamily N-acetyltransferase
MVFELTDSLCKEILFAMENQQKFFALDAGHGRVVECDVESVDEDSVYSLPAWTSADGFNLLESFTQHFKGNKACDELKKILSEGRGVFKNFKNALKKYPEIEKRFHLFKDKEMKSAVYEWYNALREEWGLETLDQDFYEYDDLVLEDFTFRAYNHLLDGECAAFLADAFFEELKEQFAGELGECLSDEMKALSVLFSSSAKADVKGFVCRTLTDEFAGFLTYSVCMSSSRKTAVLTGLFVNKNYRGLGIAKELFQKGISDLTQDGIHFFIINNMFVPQMLKPAVKRLGFEENDFAWVNKLN